MPTTQIKSTPDLICRFILLKIVCCLDLSFSENAWTQYENSIFRRELPAAEYVDLCWSTGHLSHKFRTADVLRFRIWHSRPAIEFSYCVQAFWLELFPWWLILSYETGFHPMRQVFFVDQMTIISRRADSENPIQFTYSWKNVLSPFLKVKLPYFKYLAIFLHFQVNFQQ